MLLQKRRRIQARRHFLCEYIGDVDGKAMFRFTCMECGLIEENNAPCKVTGRGYADGFSEDKRKSWARYWDKTSTDICKRCTKAARDKMYPLGGE